MKFRFILIAVFIGVSSLGLTEELLPLPRLFCKVTNTHNGPVDLYVPKPEVGDTFQIDLAEITKGKSAIIYDSSNKIMGRKPQISVSYPFRILKVTRTQDGKVNTIRMVSRHSEDDIYSTNLDLDYKYGYQNKGVVGISGSIRSETPTIKGITFFDCKVKKD